MHRCCSRLTSFLGDDYLILHLLADWNSLYSVPLNNLGSVTSRQFIDHEIYMLHKLIALEFAAEFVAHSFPAIKEFT